MARRPSGRLPADRASEWPESAPNPHNGLSTEGLYVPPPSEQTTWDARQALTFVHQHPERFGPTYAGLGPIADVFFALGLAEPSGGSDEHPAVPKDFDCPSCPALKGSGCLSGDGRYMRFHVGRIRLANAARPTPEKENPTDG